MRAERARSGVAGKEELSPEQEAQLRADVQQYATAADQWAALPDTMDEESLRELEAQDAEEVKEVVEG